MVSRSRVINISPKVLTLGFLMFLFTGCQQAVMTADRFTSEQGVKIETFIPADSFMLVKAGTRDADQMANLKILNGFFPNDPMGSLVREFNTGFKDGANLDEVGLDYEKDLLPILSDKSEIYFAVSPMADSSVEKIRAVLALTIADQGKFDALLNKQLEKNILKKADYNGQSYYLEADQKDTPAYLMRVKDTVLVFTDESLLKTGIDNFAAGKIPLADNMVYQKTMKDYQPTIGLIYGDFSKLMEFLKTSGEGGQEFINSLNSFTVQQNGVKDIESELLLFTAEKDGFRMKGVILAKTGADLEKLSTLSEKPYLLNKIVVVSPVFYTESYGFRKVYDEFIKLSPEKPDLAEGLQQMRDYLNSQGLDLEKDVLSFMDKGFALVLDDSGSVFPNLGFYMDASSNIEGATKVAAKINQGLTAVFSDAKKENPELAMFVTQEEVNSGKLWKFKVNLDAFLTEAPPLIAQKLSGQKIELYYGLLEDKTFVFVLTPDLDKVHGKNANVAQSAEFKLAVSHLNGADKGVSYFAPEQVMLYLDRLMKIAEESGAPLGDTTEYDMVKNYILPLKSVVFASRVVSKDRVESQAFLHIGQ